MLKIQRESELDQYDLMMWRPVLAQIATYNEVAHLWTLDDLMDCLEMLEIQRALQDEIRPKVTG